MSVWNGDGWGAGGGEFPVPGVRGLEHAADVGLEIRGPTLPELFRRAALGALWLVLEREARPDGRDVRRVEATAEDLPALLREWLRTLLFWQETEGFVWREMRFPVLTPFRLEAEVEGGVDEGARVREIKGVTFHGLEVEEEPGGWCARVIFDV